MSVLAIIALELFTWRNTGVNFVARTTSVVQPLATSRCGDTIEMQKHLAQFFSEFPEELFFTTRSRQDLTAVWHEHHRTFHAISSAEAALSQELARSGGAPTVEGFSEAANASVALHVDGALENPNWRETLRCSQSQLINRSRAAITLMRRVCGLQSSSRVYVTEQTTPMYRWLKENVPHTVGSEFVDPSLASGTLVDGVRHEDLTRLSFGDGALELLASFDVLEHVPDYPTALREIARVVRPGGHLLMTFPFTGQDATTVRARLNANGEVEHLLPPEFHGDPVRPEGGILCFYHFGFDILDGLRQAGFRDASVRWYWSSARGNIGGIQSYVHAER